MNTFFTNTQAIDAVNSDSPIPTYLFDDEGNRAWKLTYVSTDGWRGYYDSTATAKHKWEKIDSSWVTGDWGDDVADIHGETPTQERLEKLAEEQHRLGYKLAVVFTPTSNVFSTAYDVYRKKV